MPPTTLADATALHALLAGGGTGGHVFPALAVAEELRHRGWRVSFAGLSAGLEERLATGAGLPFHALPARPLVGRGFSGRVAAVATVVRSGRAAAALLRRERVDVVLGTGGYVSAPAVVGARLAGRPIVLLEPNARAGVANRWASRWASAAAVAYRDTISDLKCPCRVTGVPVRAAFFRVPAELPSLAAPRLLVLGGSQGAQQINRVVPLGVARVAEWLPGLAVLHQAGPANVEETRAAYASAGLGPGDGDRGVTVEVVPFLDDVAGAMAEAHLVVSRAGAITLAEICAAGRPSLLLPLGIAQAHQVANARLLVDAEAAELLTPEEASPERVAAALADLLVDGSRLQHMARSARGLARPGATAAIADLLAELGGER
jgi:UDP-N-acetylglucosamine--N-acetylmuramyl-(pentapeptide) pyrophosphoryl-undecaprenol N-acetylglucosamine transferase